MAYLANGGAKTNAKSKINNFVTSVAIIAFILSIISCGVTAKANPTQSSYWQYDKKEHFAASAALSSLAYVAIRRQGYNKWEALVTGAALSVFIGTAKEVYDREVDSNDIKADFMGSMAGVGVCLTVDLLFF